MWSAVTDEFGTYEIIGLHGTYDVRFDDPSGGHLSLWFQDALSHETATPLLAEAGSDVSGVDAVLTPARFAGRVVAEDGEPLSGIAVRAVPLGDGAGGSTATGVDGGFTFIGLAPGSYAVVFEDPSGRRATEWFDDVNAPKFVPNARTKLPPGAIVGEASRRPRSE